MLHMQHHFLCNITYVVTAESMGKGLTYTTNINCAPTLLINFAHHLQSVTQVDLTMWQPSVCLNFLDELLTWIRKTVVKDDPK